MSKDYSHLFLSWDEYAKRRFDVAYIYSIEGHEKLLTYFGARHSFDPQHPQFSLLKQEWEKFILSTQNGKRVVFVEGQLRDLKADEESAIKSGGEGGLITYLAYHADCPVICPEPDEKVLADALNEKYSKGDIVYHRVASTMLHFFREGMPTRERYVTHFLDYLRDTFKWPDFDFSYPAIQQIHRHRFGTDFEDADRDFFMQNVAPHLHNSVYNELSRAEDVFRDNAIIQAIIDQWTDGVSVFVVYGSGHAIIEEPVLRHILR